jgi:hypothetical protein
MVSLDLSFMIGFAQSSLMREVGGRQRVASSWYRQGETSIVLRVELSGPILSEPSLIMQKI